ncbi:MAG TPA: sulfite exporter TauE/SafE family protein [Actinomycetales bacterium]|nr:sulfite exporter TauE/SafE family protein [Actinomycetales bacterium]
MLSADSAGGLLLVAAAGLAAGAVNAVAGGGTLISFPTLLAVGVPPVAANITSSVGLVTGYLGGAIGYRRELADQRGRLRALAVVAVLGGIAGAVLLLVTPADSFRAVVPYLVLLSCALLAAQPRLARWVAGRASARPVPSHGITPVLQAGVFVAAVYGSYFGAGLGVLLLGVLGILLDDSLQRLNGLKTVLAFVVNAVGVVVFLASGQVRWVLAAVLVVASYVGGLLGARVARLLSPALLRASVVALGAVVGVVLLVRS